MVKDDRTQAEKHETVGFVVATDSVMSGWGGAEGGKSFVARPVRSREELDMVTEVFEQRAEFKRVRFVLGKVTKEGRVYKPRMQASDQLHVYGFDTFLSDHLVNSRYPFGNLFKENDKKARALWSQIVNRNNDLDDMTWLISLQKFTDITATEETALKALEAYND